MENHNQLGFTTAAIGFIILIALVGVIFVARNFGSTNDSISQSALPSPSPSASVKHIMVTASPKSTPFSSLKPSPMTSSSPNTTASPQPSPSPTSTPTPTSAAQQSGRFIRITAPNGGETYKVGSTIKITWEYAGLKQCLMKYVMENGTESSLFVPVQPEVGSLSFPILESYLGPLESAKIKIDMSCYSADSNYAGDRSDGFFTITK